MNEFLESANRLAAQNRAAEQQRLADAERARTKEEADLQLSRKRAEDFVGLMREHNIPTIGLCREGDYYHIPPMQWLKSVVRDDANAHSNLQREQGRKITMFRMGWIAAQEYRISYSDGSGHNVPGIFVSDTAETFLYSHQAVSRGTPYVAPVDSEKLGRYRGAPDEGILAPEDAVQRVAQMLVQHYGITG